MEDNDVVYENIIDKEILDAVELEENSVEGANSALFRTIVKVIGLVLAILLMLFIGVYMYYSSNITKSIDEIILADRPYVEDFLGAEIYSYTTNREGSLRLLTEKGILEYDSENVLLGEFNDFERHNFNSEVRSYERVTMSSVEGLYDNYIAAMNAVNLMTCMPFDLDYETILNIDGVQYIKVFTFETLEAVRNELSYYFSDEVTDSLLASCIYEEIDGVLYYRDIPVDLQDIGYMYPEVFKVSEDMYIMDWYVEYLDRTTGAVDFIEKFELVYENIDGEFIFTEFPLF